MVCSYLLIIIGLLLNLSVDPLRMVHIVEQGQVQWRSVFRNDVLVQRMWFQHSDAFLFPC